MLGTTEWENEFYRTNSQPELDFGFDAIKSRDVDYMGVSKFLLGRLAGVFYKVHPTARVLMNSKNNPLYLLCFACGNEKGSKPAMKIAGHLLKI